MGYITLDDLVKAISPERLTALTDDENLGTINESVVNHAIAVASAEIDAYVGSRYRVPLETAHPIIRKLCVDLALYALHQRLDRVTDGVRAAYDNAVRLLRDIAKGLVSLGVEPEPEGAGSTGVVVRAKTRVFGPESEPMP